MFESVEGSVRFPALEAEILEFWKDHRIYEKSLQRRAGAPRFVFYEGPPTANGMPHPGHCLTRAIKDVFPRYRTMRGFRCERKAGWDTHGLPVEVEVCKELGIHSKEEIEAYGVEPFIHKCQESVWRYMQQWERLTERIGFWVDLEQAYVTYHQSYVESVWWALKNLFERGLLYQGHKIVWWWAQGGTALSAGEVGQGYREVADPSVFVRFPLVDDAGQPGDTSLLVWTTTPWTLPSNQFAAVHPDLEYSLVEDDEGQKLIVAAALAETVAEKAGRTFTTQKTLRGSQLIGRRYLPPFDYYYQTAGNSTGRLQSRRPAARRLAGRTGRIRHRRQRHRRGPSGAGFWRSRLRRADRRARPIRRRRRAEADLRRGRRRYLYGRSARLSRPLGERGRQGHLARAAPPRAALSPGAIPARIPVLLAGRRRSADPVSAAKLVHPHDGVQRPHGRQQQINWLPEHIRDGRFGNFLESNVDWALSRERYWGTPLPIWVSEKDPTHFEAIGSYAELLAKPGVKGTEVWEAAKKAEPELSEHLKVHKPYIDAVTYRSPFDAAGRMRRVPEVIDCWFDSGAMPFAQWGYPHTGHREFHQQFPADFISEAIDQTRGWFYSLLAISTLLFSQEDGQGTGDKRRSDPDRPPHAVAAPVPQLHRAGPDAGRRRPEDVQEQAELPRAERDLRPLRSRRAALVLFRESASLDFDPLQRASDQGQHSRVPAAALERLQLLRDLRQYRRLRSGGRAVGASPSS